MGRRLYQALLTRPDSLERVRAATPQIERAKGRVQIAPTATPGVYSVTIELPDPLTPNRFLPGLPFFEQ